MNTRKITDRRINRGIWSYRCDRANCPEALSKPCWLHGRFRQNRPFGLDLVGYHLSEIGLGEGARLLLRALDTTTIPTGLVNVALDRRMSETALADRVASSPRHAIALSICGAAELKTFARRACRGQKNIAYPYWELPTFPTSWRRALDGFDAFWAPTTFIRDMLLTAQPHPVHLVPQPFDLPETLPPTARTNTLRIFTFFDYDSFLTRKNPVATIGAFRAAFPNGREDVQLLVKARGNNDIPERAELYRLAQTDPRIKIVDRLVTRAQMTALMGDCDVFLSLHRSEGVGLGCAEALAQGKIVVSTDFGGTRDFITAETGFPVEYQMVPLGPDDYIGGEGSVWADPDTDHAASVLRQIYDDPDAASAKPKAGFELLHRVHSFKAVGKRIEKALREP